MMGLAGILTEPKLEIPIEGSLADAINAVKVNLKNILIIIKIYI